MNRILFACTLVLGGIIGMVGWAISCAQTVEAGAVSNVILTINKPEEIIIFGMFAIMMITGLLYGIKLINTKI